MGLRAFRLFSGDRTLTDLIQILALEPQLQSFADALSKRVRAVATGAAGSSTSLCAAAVAKLAKRPVILVVAHIDDADDSADELAGLGVNVRRLPAVEVLPGESNVSIDLFAERVSVLREIVTGAITPGSVLIAPIQSLMQSVPMPSRMDRLLRIVKLGETIPPGNLARWLDEAGYRRVEIIEEPGDFAIRGGILDVFSPGTPTALADGPEIVCGIPVRLDFFGDTLDRITEIDLETMGSDRKLAPGSGVQLVCADLKTIQSDEGTCSALEVFPREAIVILAETMEIVEQGRGYFERIIDSRGIFGPPAVLKKLESDFHALGEINHFSAGATSAEHRVELPVRQLQPFSKDLAEAFKELVAPLTLPTPERVIAFCQNPGEQQRLGELLQTHAPAEAARVDSIVAYIHRGFVWGDGTHAPIHIVPYHELIGRFTTRRATRKLRAGRAMDTFLDVQPGDYVVHTDHGISRFVGLTQMPPRDLPGRKVKPGETEEYLTLEFANSSKLHVPAVQIDKVQKYVGGFKGKPPLSTLGGQKWQNQKEKAQESAKDLAAEMLRIRAAREHLPGIAFPPDTPWQTEFEEEFPYDETEDQLAALAEIRKDMGKSRPMDRLICGDVGFGKTELAIRAAFKACEFGKQVAVLVPTTVLAEQHERTFRSRFAGYPFRIESLSRFKTDQEQREILKDLKKGSVDLVIGTHRILSKDVHFADLGLVVVDEEQRFGVEHKESLLRLRLTVDVLTLSATPIPRTLHMALLGLRDISSLTTAPSDRRAIVTEVMGWNDRRLAQAISRELARDGQIYFVHNRVHDIQSMADNVRRLAPDARIVIGHGQMPPEELEQVILKFVRHEADILVSTTIIESGIDISNANTMIINDADRFGLADLHQLRGRVGRSKHRAYCYLVLPGDRPVNEIARKRLVAIEQFSMLGAGFKIAMRDLEIRGAGNLLGAEQSGHIATVGYEMYCRLLEDSVREMGSNKPKQTSATTSIEIGVIATIPRPYIPSDLRRLEAYRRLAIAESFESLEKFRLDLIAAYGTPPRQVERLLEMAQVRVACASMHIHTLTVREKDVIFMCKDEKLVAATLLKNASGNATQASVRALPPKQPGGSAEVYFRPPDAYLEPDTLLAVLRKRLGVPVAEAAPVVKPLPPLDRTRKKPRRNQ